MKTQIANRIAALLIPLLAVAGLALMVPSDAQSSEPTLWLLTRTCSFEDSSNCFWDAGERGNQSGHSFVSRYVRQAQLTCIFYIDKGYARTHDRCIDEGYNPRLMVDLDGDGYGAERS